MSLSDYQNSYQISPIILVGGIAGTGMLPLVSVLSSQSYSGIQSSAAQLPTGDFFGQFRVVPGHTLMDNEVATYPVANQTVAANAIITNPLRVSLEMIVPADGTNATLSNKQAIITALKSTLDSHTAQGGYYNVATPSYVYQGCLLTNLTDESDGEDGAQVQIRWIWNFMQPLLTVSAAVAAQNQAMNKTSTQTYDPGNPPTSQPIATGVGQPSSNITQNLVPAAAGPVGSNVAPPAWTGFTHGRPAISSVSPISAGSN